MTTTLHITVLLPAIPLLRPAAARAILVQEVGQEVTGVVEAIATHARDHTPAGVSGIARGSIGTRVTVGQDASHLVLGEVFSGAQAPYFIHIEEDTAPHFPPRAPLELWAARVLGDAKLWYVVARTIARRGTRGRHMMRGALATVAPTIQGRMQGAVDRAARRLGGR